MQVGVGDDGIGSVTIPGIDDPLEVVGHAEGEASLGDGLPDHELVQVGDQGLGHGIEARSASFDGRSGGGAGSETGWGVISARALVAQRADACRRIEAALKSGTLELRQKSH